jgi:glycosyltransferase involved in cell wall biosynthesis
MRIGIDAREIQDGVYTGIGRSLYNFIRYFARSHYSDRCVLFTSKPLEFPLGDKIENHVMEEESTFFWDQVQLPIAIKQNYIDVFYSPYYKLPLFSGARKVCAVLDLIYLQYPPYAAKLTTGQKMYYGAFSPRFLRCADAVLTCSQFSKEEIVKKYDVDPKKIEIIPLSVSGCYQPEPDAAKIQQNREKFGIIHSYILYTGNFKPHKNISTLIRAFALIVKRFPEMTLVLAGPKEEMYQDLLFLQTSLGLGGKVVFTGKITDEETSRLLYAGAAAFVMPSLYEGFGLPPVEAMGCGVPVVCSNVTSLPEAVAGSALLIDATKPEVIAAGVEKVLTDEGLRKDMIRRGQARARDLDDGRISGRMYDLFRRVASICP